MAYSISIFLVYIASCLSAPMDEPIRVDLPVYEHPEAGSNIQLTRPVEKENRYGEATSDQDGAAQFAGGYFAPPVTTLEGAFLETEGWGSKKLTIKENLHGIVAGLLQPKPIVDTIKEEEKYGNHGDKFYSAGRALVGGAEGVSNLVSSVLEVPGSIFRKITRIATEKLNNLGGKLIGL